jgi:hypothetical protein
VLVLILEELDYLHFWAVVQVQVHQQQVCLVLILMVHGLVAVVVHQVLV